MGPERHGGGPRRRGERRLGMTLHTFLDVDRLRNETDRRFHASDIQRVDGAVQVVPSAAFKLAPRVTPRAWERNEQHLGILATEALEQGNTLEWIGIQRERCRTTNGAKPTGSTSYASSTANSVTSQPGSSDPADSPPNASPRQTWRCTNTTTPSCSPRSPRSAERCSSPPKQRWSTRRRFRSGCKRTGTGSRSRATASCTTRTNSSCSGQTTRMRRHRC